MTKRLLERMNSLYGNHLPMQRQSAHSQLIAFPQQIQSNILKLKSCNGETSRTRSGMHILHVSTSPYQTVYHIVTFAVYIIYKHMSMIVNVSLYFNPVCCPVINVDLPTLGFITTNVVSRFVWWYTIVSSFQKVIRTLHNGSDGTLLCHFFFSTCLFSLFCSCFLIFEFSSNNTVCFLFKTTNQLISWFDLIFIFFMFLLFDLFPHEDA